MVRGADMSPSLRARLLEIRVCRDKATRGYYNYLSLTGGNESMGTRRGYSDLFPLKAS